MSSDHESVELLERGEELETMNVSGQDRIFIRVGKGTTECVREFPHEKNINDLAHAKYFVVYRRVPEDENNEENDGMESFFAGKLYPVEKDKNVLKYRISKDGRVFRVLKEGGKEEVKALKEEEKVLEGEFYRPTVKGVLGRKTYSIELRNNTEKKVTVFSGRKYDFTLLTVAPTPDNEKGEFFTIKPSSDKKFRIGLRTSSQNGQHTVDMYKLVERIRLLEMEETSKGIPRIVATLADGQKPTLQKEATKIYREADKSYWRNAAQKAGIALASSALAGTLLGVATALVGSVL